MTESQHLNRIEQAKEKREIAEAAFYAAILAAWDDGVSIRQIAKAAGYKSHGTLYQFVKRNR